MFHVKRFFVSTRFRPAVFRMRKLSFVATIIEEFFHEKKMKFHAIKINIHEESRQ